MSGKVYRPQPWIHAANCEGAPVGLLVITARAAAATYPHGRPHPECLDPSTTQPDDECVVEPADVDSHEYVKSSIWPEGAVGFLCAICRGNNPAAAEASQRTVMR